MKGSIKDNQGIKVIWSVFAITLAIFLMWLLQSMTWLFPMDVIRILGYLTVVFGVIAALIMW
jgi:hypothetical protein